MHTLVLDQGYVPQRIVPWQRAVCMLFVGKAEVVEEYGEEIRSVSTSMAMPAVVRVTRAVKRPRHEVRFSRAHVLLRDGHRCQYCARVRPPHELTFDHVIPRSRGGPTSWENIVTACVACNARKGNKTPEEARMPLARRPVRPRWLAPLRALADGHAVPEPWRAFLLAVC